LKRLFELDSLKDNLLFKGGTSLSKVYNLIRRFSEDIDVSIRRSSLGFSGSDDPAESGISGNERKKRIALLKEAAQGAVSERILPELRTSIAGNLGQGWDLRLDPSDPDGQSLEFVYPRSELTADQGAYIRPSVKIEFGARADHWPAETKVIRSYLGSAIVSAAKEPDVKVNTLSAVRTFWEKATILHQEAHRAPESPLPPRHSRHYCDLAAMIDAGVGDEASQNEKLLKAVVDHKSVFFRSASAHYETAVRGTLQLCPSKERIPGLAEDLGQMREMFFGEPPVLDKVISTLKDWERRFNEG
jgi:hypothetical protein